MFYSFGKVKEITLEFFFLLTARGWSCLGSNARSWSKNGKAQKSYFFLGEDVINGIFSHDRGLLAHQWP
jgi:hypothetical protein